MGEKNHARREEPGRETGGVALAERPVEATATAVEAAISPDASQENVVPGRAPLGVLIGLGVLAVVAIVLAVMVLGSIQRRPEVLPPEETTQVEEPIPSPSPEPKPEPPSAGEQLWGDRMNQLQDGRKHWYIFGNGDIWDYVDDGRPAD